MLAGADRGPLPTAFTAATDRRKPEQEPGQATATGLAVPEPRTPGGVEETSQPVMGLPPAWTAPTATSTVPGASPAEARTTVGAPGADGAGGGATGKSRDAWAS